MDSNYTEVINGSLIEKNSPASINIVSPPTSHGNVVDSSGQARPILEHPWRLSRVGERVPIKVERQVMNFKPVPPCIHDFVTAVAGISGVQCVIVEDGEQDTIHVTTFARSITDALREAVYALEVETIRRNPNLAFDFHLRSSDGTHDTSSLVSGKHYFAIWGGINADPA